MKYLKDKLYSFEELTETSQKFAIDFYRRLHPQNHRCSDEIIANKLLYSSSTKFLKNGEIY